MKKPLKVIIIVFSSILLVLFLLLIFYIAHPSPSDFNTFIKMREYQEKILKKYNCSEREINSYFTDYKISLPLLYRIVFKTKNLSLYLKSYFNDRIETATISQFEIGSNSGNYFDYTFMIRPKPGYNVPLFHGDALKALPGVTSALYMDFYSLNNQVDSEYFFKDVKDKLEEALKLAEPYWKTEGFGELTPHLDPYKSKWRLEMVEPDKGTEEEKRKYFETAYTCYTLYLLSYMEALSGFDKNRDSNLIDQNKKEIKDFVSILYNKDIAVKMGKMIFPEKDFDTYFLNGFWGIEEQR